MLVVKQAFRQRLCKLCFAHARRAKEQKGADRPVGVLNAGAGADDGFRHFGDGFILANHALVEDILQVQQLLALALHQAGDGDARPTLDDAGNLFFGHLIAQQAVSLLFLLRVFSSSPASFAGPAACRI